MTVKESLLQAVEELPPQYVNDLAEYAQRLRRKAANREVPTALGSQDVRARDCVRPEEGDTWKDTDELRQIFQSLTTEWKAARGYSSKLKDLAMHPAYQRIIGLGEPAIPLLLEELDSRPDHWAWALRAITGVDPVPDASRGKLRPTADAWIKWGRDNGYEW